MSGLTTDPSDPRLGHGSDTTPVPQNDAYLLLSQDERRKGFVRPVRRSYRHAGAPGPKNPLRELTPEEHDQYDRFGYVRYEAYPDGADALGRYWTRNDLDSVGKGCQAVTTMSVALAETYARNPAFYGATYCVGCRMHRPVGPLGEFTWVDADGRDTGHRVGT